MNSNAPVSDAKRLNSDLLIGLFSLSLAVVAYFNTRDLSKLGGVFVDYILVAMAVLGAIIAVKGFIKPDRVRFFESMIERNNVLIGVGILLLYLIFLPLAGFLASSYVFYFCFNLYLADDRFTTRNILFSALLTAVVVTAFYFIFKVFLGVPLPQSTWLNG
ncbi:MAG: tripartite tricarboxylate transporter TctB family protein [Deltaproteobacteria bacterium]|nr:tripartite tricarboxylate transporter TctB family protein [Deltaproteobacteria bacterium]